MVKNTWQEHSINQSQPTTILGFTGGNCRHIDDIYPNKKNMQEDDSSSECLDCCSLFSSSIDWWPIIICFFIFLTFISLPGSKSRPSPLSL